MSILEEVKETVMDENIRGVVTRYLKEIESLKVRGGETEVHKMCYHIAEEFIKLNELTDRYISYTIEDVAQDSTKTEYQVKVLLQESDNTGKYIYIFIDAKTMLIVDVEGLLSWYTF